MPRLRKLGRCRACFRHTLRDPPTLSRLFSRFSVRRKSIGKCCSAKWENSGCELAKFFEQLKRLISNFFTEKACKLATVRLRNIYIYISLFFIAALFFVIFLRRYLSLIDVNDTVWNIWFDLSLDISQNQNSPLSFIFIELCVSNVTGAFPSRLRYLHVG